MSDEINFLITMTNGDYLLKVALGVSSPGNKLKRDCIECPMEPENKEQLFNLLPNHLKSFGKIVDVETIFDIAKR